MIAHEYKHIRILEDEMFEDLLAAKRRGDSISKDTIEVKAINYLKGMAILLNPDLKAELSTESIAQILTAQLFMFYTETNYDDFLVRSRHLRNPEFIFSGGSNAYLLPSSVAPPSPSGSVK